MASELPISSSIRPESPSARERRAEVHRLRELVTLCPTDSQMRSQLATALEGIGQSEEALLQWKAILISDPNNLNAWERLTACRKLLQTSDD